MTPTSSGGMLRAASSDGGSKGLQTPIVETRSRIMWFVNGYYELGLNLSQEWIPSRLASDKESWKWGIRVGKGGKNM